MDGKKRSANFTYAEKSFLFTLIAEKYGGILEDKKTDRASLQKREEAWNRIEKDFNAVSPSNNFREADHLKKFYCNKKKEVRQKVAEERKETLLTGGGPPPKVSKYEDDLDGILLSIMNTKTVHGLDNPCDSDIGTLSKSSSATALEFQFEEENANPDPDIMVASESQESPSLLVKPGPTWKRYTPSDLRRPKNPELVSKERKANENFPKTPVSRRRPTGTVKTLTSSLVAQKYDLLLDKRLVLVEKQIKQIEDEHELNLKRKSLEIECLQVDLALKKKQFGFI